MHFISQHQLKLQQQMRFRRVRRNTWCLFPRIQIKTPAYSVESVKKCVMIFFKGLIRKIMAGTCAPE